MATYSTIKGFNVQTLSSDPYASVVAAGTFASGGSKNTSSPGLMVAGIQTAAVATGNSGGEEYNGTAWTETGDLNTTRHSGGMAGTQTDAIYVQGRSSPSAVTDAVETYNGTSWSSGTAAPNSRYAQGSCGATSNAYLGWGGSLAPPSSPATYSTGIEWNGSSWTASGSLTGFPAGRQGYGGVGIQTAALSVGGQNDSPGSIVATSEEYNGSSWTAISSTPTILNEPGQWGTTTSAIVTGGYSTTYIANTIAYDGSAWADLPSSTDASSAQAWKASTNGTSTTGLAVGNGPVSQTATIEWNAPATVSVAGEGQVWYNSSSDVLKGFGKSISLGAWVSGGAMNTGRSKVASAGTYTAALAIGGSPTTAITEKYDGSSWTETGDLNQARSELGGAGTQTAALAFGGGSPNYDLTEKFDGTSWTEVNDLNTGRQGTSGCGFTNTAALCVGGSNPGYSALTEKWDGTSWAESGGDLNTAREFLSSFGSSTAAIAVGGLPPPSGAAITEKWDGTSWTEVNDLNTARQYIAGTGSQATGLAIGGYTTTQLANVEAWDGTSWTEVADIATAKNGKGAASTTGGVAYAVAFGGNPASDVTEEWTGGTAIKTFTAS